MASWSRIPMRKGWRHKPIRSKVDRKLLESLWPPHELTKSEKDQVVTAVHINRQSHHPYRKGSTSARGACRAPETPARRSTALRSSCLISSTTINRGTGPCSLPQTGRPGSLRETWSRRTPSGATCKNPARQRGRPLRDRDAERLQRTGWNASAWSRLGRIGWSVWKRATWKRYSYSDDGEHRPGRPCRRRA